ncbi:Calpain catalytic domain-containing protein [Aphelenchoides besseyi]|nr:Calpain catalytic domain-containing protein [Aphelenchoides besseyi]
MPPSGADANIPLTPENNSTFTQALQQWLGRFFGWIYSPGITPTRMLTATSTSDIVANEPSSIQPQSAASSIHQNPPSDPKNTKSETREGQTNTVNMKLDIAIGINGPVLNQANVPLTNDYKSVTISDMWSTNKKTAGGAPGQLLNQFHRNPQFVANVSAQNENDKQVSIVYELALKQPDKKPPTTPPFMGVLVYRVPEEESERTRKFEPSFFNDKTNLPVFYQRVFSGPICRESFTLDTGLYLFVPSTFNPGENGEFVLRIFAKGKIVVVDLV